MKQRGSILTILSIIINSGFTQNQIPNKQKETITIPRYTLDDDSNEIDLLNELKSYEIGKAIFPVSEILNEGSSIHAEEIDIDLIEFDSDTITVPINIFRSVSYNDRGGLIE